MNKVLEGVKDIPDPLEGVKNVEIKVYPDVLKKLGLGKTQYNVLYLIDGIIDDPEDPFWRLRNVSLGLVTVALGVSRQRVNAIVQDLVRKGLVKRTIIIGLPNVWPTRKWYEAMKPYREKNG